MAPSQLSGGVQREEELRECKLEIFWLTTAACQGSVPCLTAPGGAFSLLSGCDGLKMFSKQDCSRAEVSHREATSQQKM